MQYFDRDMLKYTVNCKLFPIPTMNHWIDLMEQFGGHDSAFYMDLTVCGQPGTEARGKNPATLANKSGNIL